jgi:hypothetical protein
MTGSEGMFLPGKGYCKFMNDDHYGDDLLIEMFVIW